MSAIDPADLAMLYALEGSDRLELVDGDRAEVLPGVDLIAAHETHTPGHQVVAIRTRDGVYVAAGDCVMAEANLGRGGREAYVPVGSVHGSQVLLFELYDRMLERVDGQPTRILAVHDGGTWSRYPTSERDGLHIAEVHRARRQETRNA